MIYLWTRQGRRPATLFVLAITWIGAAAVWAVFDAAWFVLAVPLLASVPVLWDVIRNPELRLEVWEGRILWVSGLQSGDSASIEKVRLDRRFDGGLRITLIHSDTAHTRLPPDITPPADAFETALTAAGISAERHPFSPF
ncbi:hypothetical protein [Pseudooctadecabacter sp.]|uniref:hypothetical protein n=1 Tax=Pseudooctadecabacter sp. TaxID=1966338 RepID=UPI0025E4FEAD|nr:hypothetical protein [Pseudooctadecabacter sp.]